MHSTFHANCAEQNHLLENSRLIECLDIETEFGVSQQDLTGEAKREKYARTTYHKIRDVCLIKGLQVRPVS
jgi:hypothetical protein